MNKQSFVSGFKVATLTLVFAVAFSISSFAEGSNNDNNTNAAKTYAVKYVGSVDEGYVFNVKFDNVSGGAFNLVIKDETGETLYQRSFTTKNFSKRFQLSKSIIKANFIIQPQHEAEQNFEVAIQSRITEDVVVSRQ